MHRTAVRACITALAALMLAACSKGPASKGTTTQQGQLAPKLVNVGNLEFAATTMSEAAGAYLNQGLALVYAFNHAEALRSFREVARIDPNCAMAYWGQALALAPNINDSAIGPDREQQGASAIKEALSRKQLAGQRDLDLIEALATRYSSAGKPDRKTLNAAYAAAMAATYKRHRDDPDVAALFADATMNTMPWDYWTKDGKPKPGIAEARAALEHALRLRPDHTGANHLYIHLMEASDEVDLASPIADRLGKLAPSAGHLVHMPAHIYIRVGRYADAVDANVRAVAADEDYITQCRAQGIYPAAYYPHNIHFLNAVLAMDGRAKEALDAARKVASKHDHQMMHEPGFGFAHLLKTMPMLTLVRFGRWQEILNEPEPPADQLFGRAMHRFGRGFALSTTGDANGAAQELAGLRKLAAEPSLKELKIMDLNSLSNLAEIAAAMLEGEISTRAGHQEQGIAAFRRAVDLDDSLLYSEPPDWMLPPRQYLAAALASAGRHAEAERVYREDLKRHRSNGWSLFGLEQTLRKQNKQPEADRVKQEFAKAWSRADVTLAASRF